MDKWVGFLFLGIPKEHQGAVAVVLWRFVMLGFILWACGTFTVLGFSGFLFAADARELESRVDRLQQSADISARINLAQEIRLYVSSRCKADDKEPYNRIIERLQIDYERITGARYAEPGCL